MSNEQPLNPVAEQVLDQFQASATQANADIASIQKSMTTGYNIGGTDQEGASALRRQSLADDVKLLTFGNQDFTIFNDVARKQARSTVEQYSIQTGYGRSGSSLFVPETGVGSINDPQLGRKLARMKYVSDTRQTSIASTLVNNVANPQQVQLDSAMIAMAKTIEYGIFYGNENLTALGEGQGLEFNGLTQLVDQEHNILDLRGESLSEKDLNQASVTVAKGYGRATDAYMPVGVHADFVNNQLNRQWISQGTTANLHSGFNVPQFMSTRGAIRLHGSTIMDNERILDERQPIAQGAPAKPKVEAVVETGKAGLFREADIATHEYAVRVVTNGAGHSVAEHITAVVANATDGVKLTVTPANLYQARPDFAEVYRKDPATGGFFLVARKGFYEADPATGALEIYDLNEEIPGCSDVFVGELSEQVLALYELLPMTKLPLAQVNATLTFAVLWYGALALFAPKKWVRIRNVKTVNAQVPH